MPGSRFAGLRPLPALGIPAEFRGGTGKTTFARAAMQDAGLVPCGKADLIAAGSEFALFIGRLDRLESC